MEDGGKEREWCNLVKTPYMPRGGRRKKSELDQIKQLKDRT